MKKFKVGLCIIITIIIIVLIFLLGKYIKLYDQASKPKYGYYLNEKLQITSVDLINHNSIYEFFSIGEYKREELLNLIKFINYVDINNKDNKYLYVKILFNNIVYDVGIEEEYANLCKIISNEQKNYFLNVKYNEESGFINLITIEEI